MTFKAIILHLRLPFSMFLMPVFWFAVSQSTKPDILISVVVFIILHLLVYPASNAYNSYFDKDEGSIGGLENPPKVGKELFWVAWCIDILAVILGFFLVSPIFALEIFIYQMISKAYSHDKVRLKKYPILSWFIVGIFQGAFTYLMILQAVNHLIINDLIKIHILYPAFLSTMMLWAVYPMTQIYQHDEDAQRGDLTLSYLLGIRGTFYFTAFVFTLAFIGFFLYLTLQQFIVMQILTLPVLVFFGWWFWQVYKNEKQANFKNTMLLNLLASVCLNTFYLWVIWH